MKFSTPDLGLYCLMLEVEFESGVTILSASPVIENLGAVCIKSELIKYHS